MFDPRRQAHIAYVCRRSCEKPWRRARRRPTEPGPNGSRLQTARGGFRMTAVVGDLRRRPRERDKLRPRRAGELRLAAFGHTRDPAERDALVERHLPLARSLAARYCHTNEPF